MLKLINTKNLMRFVFISFVLSAAFVIVRLTVAPVEALPSTDGSPRIKSDYILMLLQCTFGIIAMLFPGFLTNRMKLNIPTFMLITYTVFLYLAIFLGEVRNFYYHVPYWDKILHIFSGAAIGALGFSVVSLLNKPDSTKCCLSPFFTAMFAFSFSVALGVVWELYEFTFDTFLGTNMLKYRLESGEILVGMDALDDTLKDLVVDVIGAFIMSVIGYISVKYNKGWLEGFRIRKHTEKDR